jgi:hypothetical protein
MLVVKLFFVFLFLLTLCILHINKKKFFLTEHKNESC